jgi:phosphoesterase RecJ-like protein
MSRAAAIELIRRGRRFLVACHRVPDADALGSALGLAAVLRAAGKDADVYCPDEPSESLRFLPGITGVLRTLDGQAPFDATFVMDLASSALLPEGFPARSTSGTVVVVDHHAAHDDFGDLAVRELDACATGEVVVRMMEDLGIDAVPADAATPIYAAVVADTGGFRYAGTRPDTLRLGARLLEAGVDPWQVAYHLFEGFAPERLALLREVLATLRMHADGRVAVLRVTREMLARTGGTDEMVEGMVNYARSVRGVEIAALLWEKLGAAGALSTKVSLRSRGPVDVTRIATAFGGGGHRAAAGAQSDEGLDAVEARIVALSTPLLP